MGHHEERISEITNPGGLRHTSTLNGVGTALLLIGSCALGAYLLVDPQLAWVTYLQGYFFAFCLGMAGIFFVALNYLTKSVWSVPVRRIAESMSAYLPYALYLVVPIIYYQTFIYEWARPDHAHLTGSKATYLSSGFWSIRIICYLLIWNAFAKHFRSISIRQDDHKQSLVTTLKSAIFLVVFGFSLTLFSIDLLMSIRSHWFSTMYGVYCFAGMFQAGLATIILLTLFLRKHGYLDQVFKDRHLFDLGTWLLAWCTFMVYIGFSQFMLIWYANLPEETVFFIDHLYGDWKWLYIGIFFLKWGIPFFVLMPKPARRSAKVLTIMCISLIIAEWLDIYWMVSPEFIKGDQYGVAFGEHFVYSVLVALGFLGGFILVVTHFLKSHPVIPVGEPKLLSSANGDYL